MIPFGYSNSAEIPLQSSATTFEPDRQTYSSRHSSFKMRQSHLTGDFFEEYTDRSSPIVRNHSDKGQPPFFDCGPHAGAPGKDEWAYDDLPFSRPMDLIPAHAIARLDCGSKPVTPSNTPRSSDQSMSTTASTLNLSPNYHRQEGPISFYDHGLPAHHHQSHAPYTQNVQTFEAARSSLSQSPLSFSDNRSIRRGIDDTSDDTANDEGIIVQDKLGDISYAQLIYSALMEARDNRMVLKDIYRWIERNTDKASNPDFKGWQNSVRHNLSMNKVWCPAH